MKCHTHHLCFWSQIQKLCYIEILYSMLPKTDKITKKDFNLLCLKEFSPRLLLIIVIEVVHIFFVSKSFCRTSRFLLHPSNSVLAYWVINGKKVQQKVYKKLPQMFLKLYLHFGTTVFENISQDIDFLPFIWKFFNFSQLFHCLALRFFN